MPVILHLAPDVDRRLRARAAQSGLTLESFQEQLAARETAAFPEADQQLSLDELDHLLDALSDNETPLPHLPTGFSRADIYAGND